ncbi:MAG: MFS transporter [Anaerolineae bacterium]
MQRIRFLDYITLNIYWLSLNVASNSLHPIILPVMVQELVPAALKATYLGFLTFAGLVVAIVVQPVMGTISDRSTLRWGRRRPFIVAGTLLDLVFLIVIALAGNYWILLAGLLLLQFASNTAHGPLQGLIPDLVPKEQRGTASGVKGLIEIMGAIVASLAAGYLVGQGQMLWAIGLIMVVFLGAMLITVLTVHEERWGGVPEKPLWATVLGTFNIDIRRYPDYLWWLVNRFLFFTGLTSIQTFLLYFIEDVVGLPNPAQATGNLVAVLGLAILVIVFPAGYLADRVGRKPLLILAGLGATVGGLLFLSARSYGDLLLYGGIIGLSAGVFISAGWALATDLVPQEEAGRYLGVSNLATAGGSAVARLGGPFIDFFNARQAGLGYTVVFAANGLCFLLATLALLKVREVRAKEDL